MKSSKKYLVLAAGFVLSGCVAEAKHTKLDRFGVPLKDQSLEWNSDGDESTYDKWSCVLDNETNLIWEVKSDDGGLRDFHWSYTWFDPNSSDGDPGWYDRGYCLDDEQCDIAGYVEAVNDIELCGGSDWRIPASNIEDKADVKSNELLNIVDNSKEYAPFIDLALFPNDIAINSAYWTAEPYPDSIMGAVSVSFGFGEAGFSSKSKSLSIRLVRTNDSEK